MIQEWKDQYNSFNSWKGLLYSDWYKAIIEWRDGKRTAPLPPIEVSLDPVHACNLMCEHCNAHRYLDKTEVMSEEHLLDLTKFLGDWGVKAICYGGGGEPTLHSKLPEAIELCTKLGVQSSVATNGTLINGKLSKVLANNCRWVGISVDAATPKTYEIGRKANLFHRVIRNISQLVSIKGKADIAFKFLVFGYNQNEIFEACKIAKDLGVRDFHARPADFRHQGLGEWKKKESEYNLEVIKEQMEKCHEIEDKDFRVFTVVHKFNKDFTPRRRFSGCFASPICIQLCANGKVYLCPDTRQVSLYELGSHADPKDILKFWGSKKHYDLVFKTGCKNCTSRCTFSPYNEQMERLFVNQDDPMCWRFV